MEANKSFECVRSKREGEGGGRREREGEGGRGREWEGEGRGTEVCQNECMYEVLFACLCECV